MNFVVAITGLLYLFVILLRGDVARNNFFKSHSFYWDAAVVAAAQALGALTLYSDDLNDGQEYGGVRVINPFATRKSR